MIAVRGPGLQLDPPGKLGRPVGEMIDERQLLCSGQGAGHLHVLTQPQIALLAEAVPGAVLGVSRLGHQYYLNAGLLQLLDEVGQVGLEVGQGDARLGLALVHVTVVGAVHDRHDVRGFREHVFGQALAGADRGFAADARVDDRGANALLLELLLDSGGERLVGLDPWPNAPGDRIAEHEEAQRLGVGRRCQGRKQEQARDQTSESWHGSYLSEGRGWAGLQDVAISFPCSGLDAGLSSDAASNRLAMIRRRFARWR